MQHETKKIVILGSTGSVGSQALEVIHRFPDQYQIVGLSANQNVSLLLKQAKTFKPKVIAMMDKAACVKVKERLKLLGPRFRKIQVLFGLEGLCQLAELAEADLVLTALVGSVGLKPTAQAIKKSKTIALANKETLVTAGSIIMDLARQHQAFIIPVDSEHSAIYQCLVGEDFASVRNLILTCSGGPFRKASQKFLEKAKAQDALKHPTWNMGQKISIDSATLMNKGLEIIEAHWLFSVDYAHIKVLVHPQSLVHSLVEFQDGSLKAQISQPTMKIPIQFAFSCPARQTNPDIQDLNLESLNQMTFNPPDLKRFPCLRLAREAGQAGGSAPTVLNAANEIAVELFLQDKIKFLQIPKIIQKSLSDHHLLADPTLEQIIQLDTQTKTKIQKQYSKK
ncbi:MAG: 1-deoxy-D-xylulose-5-phosphate reductoisomerase [Candidatus Moranbacteria bacterium]|nr:1-deoxy-D-xylulose-5-phosphate reductoisomerase [Candidatus Moranbacteria bacterium]